MRGWGPVGVVVGALACSALEVPPEERDGGLDEVPSACVECLLCAQWDVDGDGDLDGDDYVEAIGSPGADPYADRLFAAFWGTRCAEQCTSSCVWCHWLDGACDEACACAEPDRSFLGETWGEIDADRPTFDGAEGFGATSVGGRGGLVVEVTNLDPEGPGSLRAALELTIPRTIVFDVAGTILLEDAITLTEDNAYVTVAGDTAPGLGVQVAGYPLVLADGFHDGAFRHLRFRPGLKEIRNGQLQTRAYADPCDPDWECVDPSWSASTCTAFHGYMRSNACVSGWENLDAVKLGAGSGAPVTDVIFDHCAFNWAIDEAIDLTGAVDRVTFQWSIIGEGSTWGHVKGPHNFGPLLEGDEVGRITFHHNLFVHNTWRNPLITAGQVQFINNVVYNFELGTQIRPKSPGVKVDIVGNIYKFGPDAVPSPTAAVDSNTPNMIRADDYGLAGATGEIHIRNNAALVTEDGGRWAYAPWTDDGLTRAGDFNDMMYQPTGHAIFEAASAEARLDPQWPVSVRSLQRGEDIHAALDTIVDNVGPWRSDTLDARLIHETKHGGGSWGLAAHPGTGRDEPFPEL